MPSIGRRSSADASAYIVHGLAVLSRVRGLCHLQATRNQLRRRTQTGSVPGRTTEACGGRGDPKAATASRPAQGRSRRKSFGPGTKGSDRSRRQGQRGGTCAAHSQRLHQRRAGLPLRYHHPVQVSPYAPRALYQVYTAPGQVTDIALQEGEQLVGSGPVAAGDTVRWIIGDTESGTGPTKRVHIEVKPTRPDLVTNLVI